MNHRGAVVIKRAALRSLTFLAFFLAITLLVQFRLTTTVDTWVLASLTVSRPMGLIDLMNWAFRLGFAQVDLAIAMGWSAVILVRRRSLGPALAPLLIVVVTAVQVGLRLVVNQPEPGSDFDVSRPAPANTVASSLDRADTSVRTSFEGVTQPIAPSTRGSFPSGHASRAMFLALLGIQTLRRATNIPNGIGVLSRPRDQTPRHRTGPGYLMVIRLALALVTAFPFIVGYSALYFGYHWPSDIIAGYFLAFAIYSVARWCELLNQSPNGGLGGPPRQA